MIEGLGCIRLTVRDLGRSVDFYARGLRFAKSFASDVEGDPDAVRLMAGTLCLELITSAAPAMTSTENGVERGVSLSVAVRGLDAYHDALVERGLTPSRPKDHESDRTFVIADPDGYVWRFIQSDR